MQHNPIVRPRLLPIAIAMVIAVAGCQSPNDAAHQWQLETLVPGSAVHSPNGITFGPDGALYAGSVGAQRIYRIDVATGAAEIIVDAPAGEADDIAFAPDGTMVWTALVGGEIRALRRDGSVDVIVADVPLINPIHFTRDGRLFAAQLGFDRLSEFPVDATLTSTGEPRLVASKIGNLNSFEIDANDQLYGPLSNSNAVARINIESGEVTTIADQLGTVVAVNLGADGSIWAIDWAGGVLWHIKKADGADQWAAAVPVASLEPPLDNLAVGPDGAIYISRPAHSAIERIDPVTGAQETIINGSLAAVGGMAIMTQAGEESLLVADGYGYRAVATGSGAVTATFDLTAFAFPGAATAAAANEQYFALTDAVIRPRVYLVERDSGKTITSWRGIESALGIILNEAGNPLVTDFKTGSLIELNREQRKLRTVIADELAGPVGLAWADNDAVYVSEAVGGTLLRIELADGTRQILAAGLDQPEGITVMQDGRVAVVEVGMQRLIAIDPANGGIEVIADQLPVGERTANAPAPVYLPSGVAQGADGSLYVSGDRDNSILKLVAP